MLQKLFVFGLFINFVSFVCSQENTSCLTPTNENGSCIGLRKCPSLFSKLKEATTNPQIQNLLQKSQCGDSKQPLNPLVCCPNVTPTVIKPQSPSQRNVYTLPTVPHCGTTDPSVKNPRVQGGFDAEPGQFPWVVALGYSETRSDPKWLCGGSIITERHILTAAHCVHQRSDLYIVRYGVLKLHTDPNPIDVLIEDVRAHERYDETYIQNDIAILKLTQNIKYSKGLPRVQPICLPFDSDRRNNKYERWFPFLAGWGSLYFNGPSSDHLQGLQLPVVPHERCRKQFSNFKTAVIDNRVICAGFGRGGKDACQGDSGGSLAITEQLGPDRENYFFQIGIISYGFRCAEPGFPGVYLRVTEYIDWIQSKLY